MFLSGHADHQGFGVDDKTQPGVDLGQKGFLPTQRYSQGKVGCQDRGCPKVGCARAEEPAEVIHEYKTPVNFREDNVGDP